MNGNNIKFSLGKMILVLLLVTVMVAGGTYALMKLTINVTNGVYNVATTCFNVNYDAGEDITGTLFPSRLPTGGLTGSVTVGLDQNCNVEGTGNLYLNVNNNNANSSVLTQVVAPHCENKKTLETLADYTTEEGCNNKSGAKWVTDGTALKYAVYPSGGTEPVSVGYINGSADKINIYEGFELTVSATYDIYVWLDGNISDNSYQNISFGGDISAEVMQLEYHSAYAIYSETDNSLRFYNNGDTVNVGDTYRDRKVTAKFTEFDQYGYAETNIPWYDYRESITTVVVEEEISPINTMNWFNEFTNCSSLDLTKLDTSKVTNFKFMFCSTGYNITTNFEIIGLDTWDTSNVTNMHGVFYRTAVNVENLNLDLSRWYTSNVTTMNYMFYKTGEKSTTLKLNLSGWDTSNVTTMNTMFFETGWEKAKTFELLGLSDWNVSNVTDMSKMFLRTGGNATSFDLNLSNWNTSKVTDFSEMFNGIGFSATTWTIGNLSNWDTSNVTNMNAMFTNAGRNSKIFDIGDLSKWNTSKVTNMSSMFESTGQNSETFNFENLSKKTVTKADGTTYTAWDTSKVANMDKMFYNAGKNATNWSLDLSNWDVPLVTSHTDFNTNVESKVTPPVWVTTSE